MRNAEIESQDLPVGQTFSGGGLYQIGDVECLGFPIANTNAQTTSTIKDDSRRIN